MAQALRVGVISDTHGLLRPDALAALAGSDFIVHAGDVGAPEILVGLSRIAPVTAVRGNNDRGDWAATLPERATLRVGGASILVIHDRAQLGEEPQALGVQAIVSGHSHRPAIEACGGVLCINPGSAGRRRFRLPVSLARLSVLGAAVTAELVTLSG